MVQLKRSGTGHLESNQTFTGVKSINGKTVAIQLAGPSAHGDIRFAFKHILDTSKKHTDDDEKLQRRVWHRMDKSGSKPANPAPGAKTMGTGVIGRGAKYGDALKYNADQTQMKNTAIYLSLMDMDTLLKEMATAFVYHNWAGKTSDQVEIEFSKPCIKTADAAGHVTGPVSTCKVSVYKTGDDVFVLGHLHSA